MRGNSKSFHLGVQSTFKPPIICARLGGDWALHKKAIHARFGGRVHRQVIHVRLRGRGHYTGGVKG